MAIVAVAIAAALFLFLFKGNGKEAAGLNPQRAAELAAAAMLSVKELPGSGWRLVEVDATDEDFLGSSLPDTAACDKLAPAVQAVDDVRSARLAKAGRSFERETISGEEATTVNAEVAVFPDANTIASAFDAFRAAIKSADFDRCVAAIFQEGLSSDESITSKPVNALASVPSGGVAKAYEVDYKSSSEQYVMRFEIYYWRFGNVVAQVGVFGLKDDVGKDLSQAAVDGMALGLDRAAGSNPPTAIPAVVASRTPVRSPLAQATSRTSTPRAAATSASGRTPPPSTFGRLSDLSSYKFTLKIEGSGGPLSELQAFFGAPLSAGTPAANQTVTFEVSGTYVKPDRGQQTFKIAGLTVTQTTIGRQQWTSVAGIQSGPDSVLGSLDDYSLAASLWEENFLDDPPDFNCTGRESVDGVPSRKCGIDAQTFDAIGGFIRPFLDSSEVSSLSKFSFEIWLAETGNYPVRIRLEMTGKDASAKDFNVRLDMDVTNVNSSSNRVDQPP